MRKKYNIEFFKEFAVKKNGECLSETYQNCRTKLQFRCNYSHIWTAEPRHIIIGRWCPECGYQNNRKYTVDDEFFSRDTEESFYIAGFLAADGWKTRKSGGYSIGLMLAEKDFEFLKLIKDTLKCNSPFNHREGYRNINNNGKESFSSAYSFIFHSKKCFKDLERFSVIENKTYDMIFPEWLKNNPLVHHFIRGYIDGDGCYYFGKNKNQDKHIAFSIRGKYEYLEEIHNIFVKNNVCKVNFRRNKLEPKKGKKYLAFDVLRYGGNSVLSKMYDYLYKDSTIFLPRKEKIIRQAKDFVVYGYKRRKHRSNTLNLTKEILIKDFNELGSWKNVANKYNCTSANISFWKRFLGMEKYEK